jgi:hypothetical protein
VFAKKNWTTKTLVSAKIAEGLSVGLIVVDGVQMDIDVTIAEVMWMVSNADDYCIKTRR